MEVEEKSRTSRDLLNERGFGNAHSSFASFAALGAMMMKSGSFESPKLYLLTLNSKNSIAALLTPVRTC